MGLGPCGKNHFFPAEIFGDGVFGSGGVLPIAAAEARDGMGFEAVGGVAGGFEFEEIAEGAIVVAEVGGFVAMGDGLAV